MRKLLLVSVALLLLGSLPSLARADDDIVLDDFNSGSYGNWEVSGEAFGEAPATREGSLQAHNVSGFEGDGAVYSLIEGDGETGTLTSPEFVISRNYINFLIGGGGHYNKTCVNLLVDGEVVRTATGIDREEMLPMAWDVSEYQGRNAKIEIVDDWTEGWGHISVDAITLSDTPAIHMYPNWHINQAMAVLAHDSARRGEDSWRPRYHYLPPSGWMNDVNGPYYKDGWYHIFYQLNAYHGGFGVTIGWGHARSRDLVHWERMPLAVWPYRDRGERSCWSGGMQFAEDGSPVLTYSSVPLFGGPFTQNGAVPLDEEGVTWDWHPDNPLLPYHELGEPEFNGAWRDPFPFEVGDGRIMMVTGGTDAGVPFYVAEDEDLGTWKFEAIGFEDDAECPNFFKIGDKWILISSAYHEGVVYFLGDFDPDGPDGPVFTVTSQGVLDEQLGANGIYGTGVLWDDEGRTIFLARMRGGHHGWDGYLALPRVLTIGDDGRPRQQPVPELEQLRTNHFEVSDMEVPEGTHVLEGLEGDNLEIIAEFEAGDAEEFGIIIRRAADGSRGVPIWYHEGKLDVQGLNFPYELPEDGKVRMHIFNDRITLEVFFDDGDHVLSRMCYPIPNDDDLQVAVFAKGGTARLVQLDAWNLQDAPIAIHPSIGEGVGPVASE